MATFRKTPLNNPFPDKFVLLDDGSTDLWWIDQDGDILYWDSDELPDDEDYEIRTTTVRLGATDSNEIIEAAFANSLPREKERIPNKNLDPFVRKVLTDEQVQYTTFQEDEKHNLIITVSYKDGSHTTYLEHNGEFITPSRNNACIMPDK